MRRRRGRGVNGEEYRDTRGTGPGRRRRALTTEQCQAIAAQHEAHPRWGVARLRQAIAGLPRNSTAAYLRRLRRVVARRRRRWRHHVRWTLPGAVWAIDGTWLDRPVVGSGRRALVVVELHSRKTLAVVSVRGERAVEVLRVLASLIAQHGAPLVLKLDNGSAFISVDVAAFCRQHGITLMHSPVRQPSWNGTCEVSGRWAKRRAEAASRRRGDGALMQADLDCAVTYVGTLPRIGEDQRRHFLGVFQRELAVVAAAFAAEQGLALGEPLRDHVRRSLGRVAARSALQLCHLVTIEGREYRQCLSGSVA